jgi:hypothetical protein
MKKLALVFLLAAGPAFAQQADPAFLQRALGALQAQRNAALDQAAGQQARADGLQADLDKAHTRVKELEAKKDEKP